MSSQGLIGALVQYWSIEPKVRLDRRNTYFMEEHLSNSDALKFGLVVSTLATAIIVFWSLMGLWL